MSEYKRRRPKAGVQNQELFFRKFYFSLAYLIPSKSFVVIKKIKEGVAPNEACFMFCTFPWFFVFVFVFVFAFVKGNLIWILWMAGTTTCEWIRGVWEAETSNHPPPPPNPTQSPTKTSPNRIFDFFKIFLWFLYNYLGDLLHLTILLSLPPKPLTIGSSISSRLFLISS